MTTPALAAAPAAAAPARAAAERSAADDGVFAGLLAGAAALPAPGALPAPRTPSGGLGDLALEELPEQPAGPALPDGALLAAQVLGLVPPTPLREEPAVPGADLVGVGIGAPTVAGPAVAAPATPDSAPAPAELAAGLRTATPLPAPAAADPQTVATPAPPSDASLTDATHPVAALPDATAPQTAAPQAAAPSAAAGPGSEPSAAPAADVPRDPAGPAAALADELAAVPAEVPVADGQPLPGTLAAAPAAPVALLGDTASDTAAEAAPEQVRPAVAELARGLRDVGGGRASLVVRLDPPELGPVLVRLTVVGGRVEVQLRAAEAVAAAGLGTAAADVRSTLLEHGLDLSSFEVSTGDLPGQGSDEDGFAQRHASSDQGTPRRGTGADRSSGASGAGTAAVVDETPVDGAPATTWL